MSAYLLAFDTYQCIFIYPEQCLEGSRRSRPEREQRGKLFGRRTRAPGSRLLRTHGARRRHREASSSRLFRAPVKVVLEHKS